MKKIINILLGIALIFVLAACGRKDTPDVKNGKATNDTQVQDNDIGKSLVVYFSLPETTDSDNMTEDEENSTVVINGNVLGNTQYVAMVIQENTGADIFRIEPEEPYTTNHQALVENATKEKEQNTRPAISSTIEGFEEYNTIFVGYPIWWSDMPMIMYSFFDEYDFSKKTIIPFNTHGGSGLAGTVEQIKQLEPNATVNENAFTKSRDDVEESEKDIINWLDELGYLAK